MLPVIPIQDFFHKLPPQPSSTRALGVFFLVQCVFTLQPQHRETTLLEHALSMLVADPLNYYRSPSQRRVQLLHRYPPLESEIDNLTRRVTKIDDCCEYFDSLRKVQELIHHPDDLITILYKIAKKLSPQRKTDMYQLCSILAPLLPQMTYPLEHVS